MKTEAPRTFFLSGSHLWFLPGVRHSYHPVICPYHTNINRCIHSISLSLYTNDSLQTILHFTFFFFLLWIIYLSLNNIACTVVLLFLMDVYSGYIMLYLAITQLLLYI